MNSKLNAYIGFAVKKGSAVFGLDGIEKYRKKTFLILYGETISENSLTKLKTHSERLKCPIMVMPETDALKRKNCKALAVTDKSLAEAIIACL